MTEISLNVLDVSENSTRAGASLVTILVTADTSADKLTIVIADDGCGMTEEELAQLRRNIEQKDMTRSKSIGLYNINQRIKLTYGDAFGIQVLSVPEEGPRVRLYLPVSRMAEKNSPAVCI